MQVAVGLDDGVHHDGVVLEQRERELRGEALEEGGHVKLHDVDHADLGAQGGDGQHCDDEWWLRAKWQAIFEEVIVLLI